MSVLGKSLGDKMLKQSPDFPHTYLSMLLWSSEFQHQHFPLKVLYFQEATVLKVMTPYVPKS